MGPEWAVTTTTPYGGAILERELAELRQAPDGTRNESLNRTAFSLGRLVAGGELDGPTVEDELLGTALELGLHPIEARSTIRSGMRAGARQPRRAPEKTPTTQEPEHEWRMPRQLALALKCRESFPFEWETAKLLALLPGEGARLEVERNRDYLARRGDVDLILRTAYLIRGTAMFRYCSAKSADPRGVEAAVKSLVWRLEND